MQQTERIQRILKAGREQFSKFGFSGARIDAISEQAQTNKRLVYEYCHTKEGLYLSVLSDVSREAMACFELSEERLLTSCNVVELYLTVVDILSPFHAFIRLWTWEKLSPTLHGPRLLETMDFIFERTERLARKLIERDHIHELGEASFESIKLACAGYLLALAVSSEDLLESTELSDETHVGAGDKGKEIVRHLYHALSKGIGMAVTEGHPNHT